MNQECADPRYKYVAKGCAPAFEQLSGKWAVPGYSGYASLEAAREAKDSYGDHIAQLLKQAVNMEVAPMQSEEPIQDETASKGMLYVVQAGEYKYLSGAKDLQKQVEKFGVVSRIKLYKMSKAPV